MIFHHIEMLNNAGFIAPDFAVKVRRNDPSDPMHRWLKRAAIISFFVIQSQ